MSWSYFLNEAGSFGATDFTPVFFNGNTLLGNLRRLRLLVLPPSMRLRVFFLRSARR
jgi:hypothetical protein